MSHISVPLSNSQYLFKISKKQQHQMRRGNAKCSNSRILITVNVKGSPGPIRLLVNEKESVKAVIHSVLKVYAREGRLPALGHESGEFYLYHASVGGALKSSDAIGYSGGRNFLMCKKLSVDQLTDDNIGKKESWRTWLKKSVNFTISRH